VPGSFAGGAPRWLWCRRLNADAEQYNDPVHSPLWQAWTDPACQRAWLKDPGSALNLVLTPHIGGQTRQSLACVGADVIVQLLEALEIAT